MKHPAPEFPELAQRLQWTDVDATHRTWIARAPEGTPWRAVFHGPDAQGKTGWLLQWRDSSGRAWEAPAVTLRAAQKAAETHRRIDLQERAKARSSGPSKG